MGDDLIALPVANPEDPEKLVAAFGDAKDKWAKKGDKMFYLHSETGNLYTWDPLPRGTLYYFQACDGQAVPIWTAAQPEFNAAIWSLLPLPPQTGTPQAAAKAAQTAQTPVLLLKFKVSVAPDEEELQQQRDAFAESCDIHPSVVARVASLEPAQQAYVMRKFRPGGSGNNSKSLMNFLNSMEKNEKMFQDSSGERVEKIMRVDYTGGILGCALPDLQRFEGISIEHAAIICHESRFFVQDIGSEQGTFVDNDQISTDWVQLRNGTTLRLGTSCVITAELTGAAIDLPPGVQPQGISAGPEAQEDDDLPFKMPSGEDLQAQKKRRAAYLDRADERKKRLKGSEDTAIDGLNAAFFRKEAELQKAEAKELEEEEEETHKHKDDWEQAGNMSLSGEFAGPSFGARAGLGFAAEQEDEAQAKAAANPDPWAGVTWKKNTRR